MGGGGGREKALKTPESEALNKFKSNRAKSLIEKRTLDRYSQNRLPFLLEFRRSRRRRAGARGGEKTRCGEKGGSHKKKLKVASGEDKKGRPGGGRPRTGAAGWRGKPGEMAEAEWRGRKEPGREASRCENPGRAAGRRSRIPFVAARRGYTFSVTRIFKLRAAR